MSLGVGGAVGVWTCEVCETSWFTAPKGTARRAEIEAFIDTYYAAPFDDNPPDDVSDTPVFDVPTIGSWGDYYDSTHQFALADKMSATDWHNYLLLGYWSEVGELSGEFKRILRDDAGEITPERLEAIQNELGDALWYFTEHLIDRGVPRDAYEEGFRLVLDAITDDATFSTPSLIAALLRSDTPIEGIAVFAAAAHTFNFDLLDCARMNIAKLASRKARGKITGSGGNR